MSAAVADALSVVRSPLTSRLLEEGLCSQSGRPHGARFNMSVSEARRVMDPSDWKMRRAVQRDLDEQIPGYVLGRERNINRDGERVYKYDYTDGFVSAYYPTRGGKGVSFIVPNALHWPHSIFFSDPKVEILKLVGGFRRYVLGNNVFCLSPTSRAPYVSHYNFLDEIRIGTFYEISDAYNLATSIVDPDGKGFADAKEAVWKRRARDWWTCSILHVLYCPEFKVKSLATVIDFWLDAGMSFSDKLKYMAEYPHDPTYRYGWCDVYGNPLQTHPYIRAKVYEQQERTEQEASSVRSEAQSYASYYQNPTVRENTADSYFSMRDLMDGIFAATLSLGITPDELEAAQPFLRLFLNSMINRNLTEIALDPVTMKMRPPHQRKLGMLLDEFAIFGRLDLFVKQLAFIAGYQMKPAIVAQALEVLKAEYAATVASLISNTNLVLFGKMNNNDEAKFFSDAMGPMTIGMSESGESVQVGAMAGVSYSTNHRKQAREFKRPEELRRFSNGHSIGIRAGGNPMLLEKLKYFEDDSGYAHLISNFSEEPSDRIPYDEQVSRQDLRRLQAEYLDWCQHNGAGVTERMKQLGENAEKVEDSVRDARERYIQAARDANKFALKAA